MAGGAVVCAVGLTHVTEDSPVEKKDQEKRPYHKSLSAAFGPLGQRSGLTQLPASASVDVRDPGGRDLLLPLQRFVTWSHMTSGAGGKCSSRLSSCSSHNSVDSDEEDSGGWLLSSSHRWKERKWTITKNIEACS
uniref:uncharacterized protein LOC118523911 isoform X4 n=1 Tax=Halichoerus grypus TaxID=9711 RepID=UPI001659D3D7|nr:uncharacterized protein LOC118523911 isoform X4 [Halichoerus grypus]